MRGATALFLLGQEHSYIINRWSLLQLCIQPWVSAAAHLKDRLTCWDSCQPTWRCSGWVFWLLWCPTRLLSWPCLSEPQNCLHMLMLDHLKLTRSLQRYLPIYTWDLTPVRKYGKEKVRFPGLYAGIVLFYLWEIHSRQLFSPTTMTWVELCSGMVVIY